MKISEVAPEELPPMKVYEILDFEKSYDPTLITSEVVKAIENDEGSHLINLLFRCSNLSESINNLTCMAIKEKKTKSLKSILKFATKNDNLLVNICNLDEDMAIEYIESLDDFDTVFDYKLFNWFFNMTILKKTKVIDWLINRYREKIKIHFNGDYRLESIKSLVDKLKPIESELEIIAINSAFFNHQVVEYLIEESLIRMDFKNNALLKYAVLFRNKLLVDYLEKKGAAI